LNAWYLKSTIIASCIDLGLQRKISQHEGMLTPTHYSQPANLRVPFP
jgi:hypothetical protein